MVDTLWKRRENQTLMTLWRTGFTRVSKFTTRENRKQLVKRLCRRKLRLDNKNRRNSRNMNGKRTRVIRGASDWSLSRNRNKSPCISRSTHHSAAALASHRSARVTRTIDHKGFRRNTFHPTHALSFSLSTIELTTLQWSDQKKLDELRSIWGTMDSRGSPLTKSEKALVL